MSCSVWQRAVPLVGRVVVRDSVQCSASCGEGVIVRDSVQYSASRREGVGWCAVSYSIALCVQWLSPIGGAGDVLRGWLPSPNVFNPLHPSFNELCFVLIKNHCVLHSLGCVVTQRL